MGTLLNALADIPRQSASFVRIVKRVQKVSRSSHLCFESAAQVSTRYSGALSNPRSHLTRPLAVRLVMLKKIDS